MELFFIKGVIAFIALFVGSITDLKKREVPDWLNYSLLALGFGINIFYSLQISSVNPFLDSLFGFCIFFTLALLMYYTGQWGGGDAKTLMGIGALYGVGIDSIFSSFLSAFIVNVLFAGALYGLFWTFVVFALHWKKTKKEIKKIVGKQHFRVVAICALLVLVFSFIALLFELSLEFKVGALSISILFAASVVLFVIIHSVEKVGMVKKITPDKLTEGDWIAKPVIYNGKKVVDIKKVGLEKKDISKIMALYTKNKIKSVVVKEGIPFIPSFLLGFLLTVFFGNILFLFG